MGLKRLREIISKAPDGTPEEILYYILDIFNAFTEAVPVRDDLTVIVLKYYGNESKDKWQYLSVNQHNKKIRKSLKSYNRELDS